MLLCGYAAAVHAATEPSPRIEQYVHRAWTTDEGLPQNSVYAIVNTRDGYLWLGTDEGLVRFDGTRFAVFDRSNTGAIHDPFVFSLREARDGTLWAGTDRGGLLRLRGGQFVRYGPENGLPAARIQAIADDRSGAVWVGLRGAGLARLQGDRFSTYSTRDGLSSDNVLAIHEDSRGRLWIGTDAGLDRFENGRFVAVAFDGAPGARGVRSIYEDRSHRFWLGTIGGPLGTQFGGGGLAVADAEGAFRAVPLQKDLRDAGVMSILEDPRGNLWIGTAGGGAARLQQGNFETIALGRTAGGAMVYALALDDEGGLWVGTQARGLHNLQNSRVDTYTTADGLAGDVIESLHESTGGAMWVGTHSSGLCRLENRRATCLSTADGLAHDRVNAVLEDPDGTLWIGTEGGLERLRHGTRTRFTTRDGLPVDHVNALLRDRDGRLWIGTWGGGVARLRNGSVEVLDSGSTSSGRYVNVLYERRGGDLWIGTTDGLSIVTHDRMRNATKDAGMPAAVEAVYEDVDGYIWIGSRRDGLFLFRDGSLTQFTVNDGLFDNLVGTILEDDSGNFWFTCNKGISRVSRQQLLDLAARRRRAVESRVFDTADGMKNRECNFGQGRWKARDGRLWFATIGGVAVVDPSRLALNDVPPRVHIEGISVDGQPLPIERPAVIPHGARRLEFLFVGLSLSAPGRVRYRYTLEGFDPGWIDGRDARSAYYTNLPAGKYRFRVTAANSDGVWSPEGSSVEYAIASPLWRRPWFTVFISLGSVALIVFIGQRRVARAQRARAVQAEFARQLIASQESERRRLAGELHDGLGQHLLVIGNWARLAMGVLDSPEQVREKLTTIAAATAQSIQSIRTMTHELQPYELEHVGLGEALTAMLQRVSEASGLRFATAIESIEDPLPADVGINVFRIAQEAVNNIVKHSGATDARVTLRRRADAIELTVADDGQGFSPTAPTADGGFGLRSLAARSRLIGATLRIQSAPGRGTTVVVDVPVNPTGEDRHAR